MLSFSAIAFAAAAIVAIVCGPGKILDDWVFFLIISHGKHYAQNCKK